MNIELTIRRLKWAQSWARNPEAHVQVLAAFFGQLRCEKEKLPAHPWLDQLKSDLSLLDQLDDGSHPTVYQQNLLLLFLDHERRAEFAEIDLQALRAQLWCKAIPPPGFEQEGKQNSEVVELDMNGIPSKFMCTITDPDSTRCCGKSFPEYRNLVMHIKFHHGIRHVLDSLVVTNQCPCCLSVFSCRVSATYHLKNCSFERNL